LAEAGLPVFASLADLGKAARHLIARTRFKVPDEAIGEQFEVPSGLLQRANASSGCLSEFDSKQMLKACGVALSEERLVANDEELGSAMHEVGFPLALKIQSADVPHKSEFGGVRLAIGDAQSGRAAYREMLAQINATCPNAAIQGVLVSPMAKPGVEIIIGTVRDDLFGPILMVGFAGE
jgi:acyl-CoA synthetase (NDP forming)